MPLLDIATSQHSFGNHICASRAQLLNQGTTLLKITFRKEKKLSPTWKVSIPRKVNLNVGYPGVRDALLIKAVSTLEKQHFTQNKDGENVDHRFLFEPDSNPEKFQSSSETSFEMDEREKLRRMRISTANKGNVPWNKGRKHSEETLRRIRERTRLAMQDPKVKMKLVNLGHAQSEETRKRIGVGVRMGWQRRREKLMVQETCFFEWQNLVAEASRRGYGDEEELQWDSYNLLDKQLEQEWLESIEHRKSAPRPKGNKRAPKSPEQRRKISEAISAKWNDPEYRERVVSALEKYHGTPVGSQKRRPRKKQTGDSQSEQRPAKRKVNDAYADYGKAKNIQARPKRKSSAPKYKDPLADSKLKMIKNIRDQRMAMETKKIKAMEQARLLVTEAEKAADSLEEAALTSPLARASLIETRKLIAEANRSIEAVETGQLTSHEENNSSPKLNARVNHYGKEVDSANADNTPPNMIKVNGSHVAFVGKDKADDLDFSKLAMVDLNYRGQPEETRKGVSDSPYEPNLLINERGLEELQMNSHEANGAIRMERTESPNGEKTDHSETMTTRASDTTNPRKKWVRGRLVEVSDSASASASECDQTLDEGE